MPAHEIDLERYKSEIIQQFLAKDIHSVQRMLRNEHQLDVSRRSLFRRLQRWGVRKIERSEVNEALSLRIAEIYFFGWLSDAKMLHMLKKDGFAINPFRLQQERLAMGLRKRRDPTQRAEAEEGLEQIMRQHLDEGDIKDYGRKSLYTFYRRKGYQFTWNSIGSIMANIDPEGVKERYQARRTKRRPFFESSGPNDLWCLDAHCKLEDFGIQIYAAIDAYSRYILWIYVGSSSRTQISVARQFLDYVQEHNVLPNRCRSDRGTELIIAAHAQRELRKLCPGGENVEFSKHWLYGKSTGNQRIESWWGQLQNSKLSSWVYYFRELKGRGLFEPSRACDRIALLAVYMNFVRQQAHDFRENWNMHHIRPQWKRPNSVSGQPFFLYDYAPDDVDDQGFIPDQEQLGVFRNEIAAWDLNEFLPAPTLNWCHRQVRRLGYDLETLKIGDVFNDGERIHTNIYDQLRQRIQTHMASGRAPQLLETEKPSGGINWQPEESSRAFEDERLDENEGDILTRGDDPATGEPFAYANVEGEMIIDPIDPEQVSEAEEYAGSEPSSGAEDEDSS